MSSQENSQKKKASRFTGVFRAGKKWKSQVQSNGVQNYLGIYDSEEEASRAYQEYKANQAVSLASSSSAMDQAHAKPPAAAKSKRGGVGVSVSALEVTTDRNADRNHGTAPPTGTVGNHALPAMPAAHLRHLRAKQQETLDRLQWDESSAPVTVELPAERLEELRLKIRLGELLHASPSVLHLARGSMPGDGCDTADAVQARFLIGEIRKHVYCGA